MQVSVEVRPRSVEEGVNSGVVDEEDAGPG